ncbi:MAG: hypothetical protein NTX86_00150 [Candidatus Dependentiae bacterium]|nr:hypothetical protein [Candidatus Dependentiae bacterium]
MKHVSLFKKYFFSFAICFFQGALSIVIGSFTVPSTQSFVTFPSADADNEMRGFASFDGGFALANNRTSCLFTSLCPVSRTIDLRLGKLALNTDLYLGDTVNFISTGTFIGNNNFIYTPAINEPLVINAAQTLSLTASVLVGLPVNSIDWNFSDQYVAAATNFSASAPELYTYSFNGGPLLSQVASTTFNFSALAVRFHPTLNYLQTSIASDIATNDTFAYRFNTSPNYLVQTGGDVLSGSGYAVAWNPRGSWVAASSDTSQYPDQAQLRIFNFNSGTGALSLLTTGTLTPIRNVQPNAMNWDSTGQYLVIGVNANATVGANELLLYYFNDTTLTSTNGVDLGRTVTAVDYSPSGTFIAAGLSAGTESLRIYRHTISNGTLVEEPSARVGETVTVNSVDWHPTGN